MGLSKFSYSTTQCVGSGNQLSWVFDNSRQTKYSFVFMLMSITVTYPVRMCKIQNNVCSEMRLVCLINTDTCVWLSFVSKTVLD